MAVTQRSVHTRQESIDAAADLMADFSGFDFDVPQTETASL